MRWDNLFDDLESQLEQGLTAEEVDLQAEEERLRLGRLSLRDRLQSLHDSYERTDQYVVGVWLATGQNVTLHPTTVGRDWLSADIRDGSAARRACVVPLRAIAGVVLSKEQVRRSLASRPRQTEAMLSAKLSLAFILRDLCRRRTDVELVTPTGSLFGTIDRVGRDHCDLAIHEPAQPRRESAVSEYRVVPLDELVMVRI